MTAPDRIWLEPDCAPFGERGWSSTALDDCDGLGCGAVAVEFVRADLSAAAVAQARQDALEEAAKACDRIAFDAAADFDRYTRRAGMTFAAAIRAIKDKEPT